MSEIAHIDCGYLATIQAKLEEKWTNPITNIDLIARADAAKAVLENQTVSFGELQSKDKKLVVSVEWQTDCEGETEDCTDDCTISGDDATPECKEYEVACLQESSFKVADRAYRERTITSQDSIADLLGRRMKLLDEWIAAYVLTGIHTNVGTNVYTGAPGTVAGTTTTIGAGDWNDNIWGYLALVEKMNQFSNSYLISGYNLFQLIYNRMAEFANADGKGNVNKMGFLQNRVYFDPFNVESDFSAHTFMLHKNAAAFIGKAWYPLGGANAVELVPGQMAYSLNSLNLPGIVYDVFTQRTCLSNEYYTAVKVQLHGLFATNPSPCSATNTGMLQFVCS
jgi:hypothetical protein